jgi:transcriptional antiterminator NusG
VIRQFLSENDHVKLEQIEVNLNDRVKIINGPFQYWEGSVTEIRPKSVKVLLPSLGYALVAEIPKSRVELISTNYAMNEAS